MMIRSITSGFLCALLSGSLVVGCGSGSAKDSAESVGSLRSKIALPQGDAHDVARVHFKIVAEGGTCDDAAIAETTTSLEEEGLLPSLAPGGAGGLRYFADGLLVLPPGNYLVCATPLGADGRPSSECARASGNISVVPEQTTEILLTSQCDGVANGGSDTIVTLNDPPVIDDLDIGPSKFIGQCDAATITVAASDQNGDTLSYAWEVISGPGASTVTGTGNVATFTPGGAGSYQLKVTVTDVYGSATSLTFPIHVSADDCEEACPAGTVEAAGLCWAPTVLDASGFAMMGGANCARFGLTGSDDAVPGVLWTEALLQEVAGALGCTVVARGGACCDPAMYVDTATNECYASALTTPAMTFVNSSFDLGPNNLPVHACQRAVAAPAAN